MAGFKEASIILLLSATLLIGANFRTIASRIQIGIEIPDREVPLYRLSTCEPLTPSPRKVEFIHIPKTGGTSLEVLGTKYGYSWGACHYMERLSDFRKAPCLKHPKRPWFHPTFKVTNWHVPPQFLTYNLTQGELREHFNPYSNPRGGVAFFAAVRDPYSRIVSEYQYRNKKEKHSPQHLNEYAVKKLQSLKQETPNSVGFFISDAHFVPQYFYVHGLPANSYLQVLHTEHLATDWSCLVRRYGLPVEMANISTANVSPGDLSRNNLNDTARALVEEIYADDFKHFGYEIINSPPSTGNAER